MEKTVIHYGKKYDFSFVIEKDKYEIVYNLLIENGFKFDMFNPLVGYYNFIVPDLTVNQLCLIKKIISDYKIKMS